MAVPAGSSAFEAVTALPSLSTAGSTAGWSVSKKTWPSWQAAASPPFKSANMSSSGWVFAGWPISANIGPKTP